MEEKNQEQPEQPKGMTWKIKHAYIEKILPDMAEKLQRLVAKEDMLKEKNVYGELYSDRQIDICYDAIIDAEYLRCRIIELLRVKPRSVKQMAVLLGNSPAEVLLQMIELRRKNMVVLDGIEDRTPIYSAAV